MPVSIPNTVTTPEVILLNVSFCLNSGEPNSE